MLTASGCYRNASEYSGPGGRIRTATPDFAFVIGTYEVEDDEFLRAYLRFYRENATPWAPDGGPIFYINNFFRDWGHQFVYDEQTLRSSLKQAGFVDVESCGLNESTQPELRGLANESRMPKGYLALETITLEATKPLPS